MDPYSSRMNVSPPNTREIRNYHTIFFHIRGSVYLSIIKLWFELLRFNKEKKRSIGGFEACHVSKCQYG